MSDFDELLKLYGEFAYLIFYPPLIILIAIYLNVGLLSWLVIGLFLTPPTIVSYYVVKRRVENYFKLLLDVKPKEWDICKTLSEYEELLKSEKAKP